MCSFADLCGPQVRASVFRAVLQASELIFTGAPTIRSSSSSDAAGGSSLLTCWWKSPRVPRSFAANASHVGCCWNWSLAKSINASSASRGCGWDAACGSASLADLSWSNSTLLSGVGSLGLTSLLVLVDAVVTGGRGWVGLWSCSCAGAGLVRAGMCCVCGIAKLNTSTRTYLVFRCRKVRPSSQGRFLVVLGGG